MFCKTYETEISARYSSKQQNSHMRKLSCKKNNHADTDSSIFLMSTPIPFLGNAGNLAPDGIVAGLRSHKRKQAFSLNDPDNIELACLVTQAAKKKAKLT